MFRCKLLLPAIIGRVNSSLVRRRTFQSLSEYDAWTDKMKASRMIKPNNLKETNVSAAAPFLQSVSPISERLLIHAVSSETNEANTTKDGKLAPRSPRDSFLQCTYPLSSLQSSDILRSSVSDLKTKSPAFRLSKFYADVDALTADVAYRHAGVPAIGDDDDSSRNVSFVTVSHFNSRKLARTDIAKDIIFRSYPTNTGAASMEVRTDAIQIVDGSEQLVDVCYTTMVAVDSKTLRPVKNAIPPLQIDPVEETENQERQKLRMEMAQQHNQMRKERMKSSLQLLHPVTHPPTAEEMEALHALQTFRARNAALERPEERESIQLVSDHTYRSSLVVYPESRNVHGKSFGGFVVEKSHSIAQYAVNFFLHSGETKNSTPTSASEGVILKRPVPVGLDEAVFLQPISIGDHVTFTARVVHSTPLLCRVIVVVEVRNPADRDRPPLRSNRLSFLFVTSAAKEPYFPTIVPDTYSEILMHIDACRRYATEGPTEEYIEHLLSSQKNQQDK